MGHRVDAVEPIEALRATARFLYPSPSIEWLDDALPVLDMLRNRAATFDVAPLTGHRHVPSALCDLHKSADACLSRMIGMNGTIDSTA